MSMQKPIFHYMGDFWWILMKIGNFMTGNVLSFWDFQEILEILKIVIFSN